MIRQSTPTRCGPSRVFTRAAAFTLAALSLAACQTNPTTGRTQLTLMSWEEEVRLGMEAKPQLVAEMGGEVAEADLRQYMTEVGQRLAATTVEDDPQLANLPWTFTLLDSDVINAFALPGGKTFMSRGLAQLMTNEAQLAGVIGHEIGHVTARHTNERFSRAAGAQVGLGVLGAVLGAGGAVDLAGQAAELALLSHSREQELESDYLGMRYMTRAGYNPAAQAQVMQILLEAARGARQPEFFSTHPHAETRIERIQERLAGEFAFTQNNPRFQFREAEFRERFLRRLAEAFPNAGPPRFDLEGARSQTAVIARAHGFEPSEAMSIFCGFESPADACDTRDPGLCHAAPGDGLD